MTHRGDGQERADLEISHVEEGDARRIREAYRVLQKVMGPGNVEDAVSFLATVSPSTDAAVLPRLVCALDRDRVQGVLLAAYLKDLNVGMVLYSAVTQRFRGQGVYSAMRGRAVSILNSIASNEHGGEMGYLLSEVVPGSRLAEEYVGRLGAFVAQCDYEQPAVQGLKAKKMELVLLPIARHRPPAADEIVAIVREIYSRVYRLPDPDQSPYLRRVVQSLGWSGHYLERR